MKTLFLLFVMVGIMVSTGWGQTSIDLYVVTGGQTDYESVDYPGESTWFNKGEALSCVATSYCYSVSDNNLHHRRRLILPFEPIEYFPVPTNEEADLLKFKLVPESGYEQGSVHSNYGSMVQ